MDKIIERCGVDAPSGPPFLGVPPDLTVYRERGHPAGRQDVRGEVLSLRLGVPDAGRDDHRPVEAKPEEIPL